MTQVLHTVGYERTNVEDFIATLRDAKIRRIIDVRAVPVSRKAGFSKNRLCALLAEHGIDYIHIAALGDPKAGREAAKAKRYKDFRRIYSTHLRTRAAGEALDLASNLASATRSCLLCFEREPDNCHRAIVANRVSFLVDLEIKHLMVELGAADNQDRAVRRSAHTREGRAPTQPAAW